MPLPSLSATAQPVAIPEGQTFSGPVATFTDPSPAAPGAYTATILWGNGQTSAGTVTALGGDRLAVSGNNVYAHAARYVIATQISRPGRAAVVVTSAAVMTEEPFWATRTFQRAAVGQPVTGALGTLTDLNLAAAASDFTAVIDWGDGTRTRGLLLPKGKGAFDIAGSHAYSSIGTRTLALSLTDEAGRTVATNPLITIDP